jgi:hypothetical protein
LESDAGYAHALDASALAGAALLPELLAHTRSELGER